VVISSDAVGRLPIKIVAPVTEWTDHFRSNVWHVRVDPHGDNGVTKTSAVDALQVKSLAVDRFAVAPRRWASSCPSSTCTVSPGYRESKESWGAVFRDLRTGAARRFKKTENATCLLLTRARTPTIIYGFPW